MNKKSIKNKFLLQLVIASATLIVIFSIILYNYIKISIYDNIAIELTKEAKSISRSSYNLKDIRTFDLYRLYQSFSDTKVSIVMIPGIEFEPRYRRFDKKNRHYIELQYPLSKEFSTFLELTKDITDTKKLLSSILKSIFFINLFAIVLIIIYALFLSEMLLTPIKQLNSKLSKMNENFLEPIDTKELPIEFIDLGNSINRLIDRIQTFVKYQKELFIGAAHELKTPLAVMKTKNEVTLLKDREKERYIEALKIANKSIDDMNKMISNILEIGRQEGAQFETPIEIDLIKFLKEQIDNFKIIANLEKKRLEADIKVDSFLVTTQPTLLTHILQNFVQNAIKFTKDNGLIKIVVRQIDNLLKIEIIDEGDGIDESKDLFAPFKRYGNKSGAGLGLFLAKSAADAMGIEIKIQNRLDAKGAVASILIGKNNTAKNRKK